MPTVSSRRCLSLSFHTVTDTLYRIVGKIASEISEKFVATYSHRVDIPTNIAYMC